MDELQVDSDLVESTEPDLPAEPAPPIQSRFLFVDIAALRAKQLRRGARVRFEPEAGSAAVATKLERLAMEEVRRGLVYYTVAPLKVRKPDEE